VPWFAGQAGGMDTLGSPTFGYLIGFVVAALALGALAGRGWDRKLAPALALFALGSLVVYAFGLPWLMVSLHIGLGTGLAKGVTPFLLGDAIKVLVAAGLLPTAWALVRRGG
jgi:biotin transport system substrate-specific component